MARQRIQNGACGKVDFLWKEYFRDPSNWYDNRKNKKSSWPADFRHKASYESLWIDGRCNPWWVREELDRNLDKTNDYDVHTEVLEFVSLLKTCGKNKDVQKGTRLHEDILQRSLLERSPYLASSLITMYSRCGALCKAHQVLEGLSVRNVVSWNALITGYVNKGQGHEALECFERMQSEGFRPDGVTLLCALRACGSTGSIDKGKQVHDEIVDRGFLKKDIVLGNALVDMYSKCGMLATAQRVLEELPARDVVSWSTLIAGYVQLGKGDEALECFARMQYEGLSPDAVTFICILKACGNQRMIEMGKKIHDEIMRKGLLDKDIVLGTALVDMYVKCGMLAKAQEVLESLPARNVISWSALIGGYAEEGHHARALDCFEQMQSEGLYPNAVTYVCILKACGKARAIDQGQRIHGEIANRGLLAKDVALGNALVDMYAKCGKLGRAAEVFEELPVRNVVAWNALISVYADHGKGDAVINYFAQMQSEGLSPDSITYICVLKACGKAGTVEKGMQIHKQIRDLGLLQNDIVLGTALVDMYAKCGMLSFAAQVLESLCDRQVISWSALISGYADQGQGHEALSCFERMQQEGLCPDAVTFICILKACGSIGAIDKGKQIHNEIVSRGFLGKDVALGTALVDMYAKCGLLAKAQEALEELPIRNSVSWSALMTGYAQHGQGHEALGCFEWMQTEGLSPDKVTFLCVMTACYHTGLLEEAEQLFSSMTREYGIAPNIDHLTCMVMVSGCAGNFDKAISVINSMPSSDYSAIWVALLGACQKWGNVELARLAFDQALQVDDSCAPAYIFMASIFAAAGMQKDAEKTEAMRQKYAAWKVQQGSVWVVDEDVHFLSCRGPQAFLKLGHTCKEDGYLLSGDILGNDDIQCEG